jgi:hypothetical protein
LQQDHVNILPNITKNPTFLKKLLSKKDNFFEKSSGLIVLYSLKNPAFSESKIETVSGCMSIDFHPEISYLLAAGFYDGTVNVYDLRIKSKKEAKYSCSQKSGQHKDPVWQVRHWLIENNLL